MFDRFPSEPFPKGQDRRTRCERCEHALTADDIKCPKCGAPHPNAALIYGLRRKRRLEREARQRAQDAAVAARAAKSKGTK